MKYISWGRPFTKKYAWELCIDWGCGFGWFDFGHVVTLHYDGKRNDHAPAVYVLFVAFGVQFDFGVYNMYHSEEEHKWLKQQEQ